MLSRGKNTIFSQ